MTAPSSASPVILDDDSAAALRDILRDPALPVATLLRQVPGGDRVAALREAHDLLTSRRIAGAAAGSAAAATALTDRLRDVDPLLVATLGWHIVLGSVLAALPPGRARNAVLGDVHRGELLTWAPTVTSWEWSEGTVPDLSRPVGRVDAELHVEHHPGLYDAILLWERTTEALIVVPTHRAGVDWELSADGRWLVRLTGATLHIDEIIVTETDLAQLPDRPPVP
jgi:hypothetical protein